MKRLIALLRGLDRRARSAGHRRVTGRRAVGRPDPPDPRHPRHAGRRGRRRRGRVRQLQLPGHAGPVRPGGADPDRPAGPAGRHRHRRDRRRRRRRCPPSGNVSIIANLDAAGNPALNVFTNDTSAIPAGQGRLVVRHTAAAPAVDIRANGAVAFANVIEPERRPGRPAGRHDLGRRRAHRGDRAGGHRPRRPAHHRGRDADRLRRRLARRRHAARRSPRPSAARARRRARSTRATARCRTAGSTPRRRLGSRRLWRGSRRRDRRGSSGPCVPALTTSVRPCPGRPHRRGRPGAYRCTDELRWPGSSWRRRSSLAARGAATPMPRPRRCRRRAPPRRPRRLVAAGRRRAPAPAGAGHPRGPGRRARAHGAHHRGARRLRRPGAAGGRRAGQRRDGDPAASTRSAGTGSGPDPASPARPCSPPTSPTTASTACSATWTTSAPATRWPWR